MFSKINTLFTLAAAVTFASVNVADATGYSLANLPADQRASICTKNVAFCLNACLQKVTANTCDSTTMNFQCICETGLSPVDPHYFPIQAQQCIGENADCRTGCATTQGLTGQALDTCSNLCDQHFVCGTPGAQEVNNFNASNQTSSTNGIAGTTAVGTTSSDSSMPVATSSMPASTTTAAVVSSTTTMSGTATTSTTIATTSVKGNTTKTTSSSTSTSTPLSVGNSASKVAFANGSVYMVITAFALFFAAN